MLDGDPDGLIGQTLGKFSVRRRLGVGGMGAVYEAEGEYYAAGMDIEVDGDLNHTGRMGGYITDFTVSADRRLTIAVMCNGHTSDRFGVAAALWNIWRPEPVE